ncbi:hypothetical protein BKA82DRAFT_4279797 [Pisolithus tinctorius]|nr:hypothetical protein BKA82DRAFT_4279797 [Pisolithus tinctorius]
MFNAYGSGSRIDVTHDERMYNQRGCFPQSGRRTRCIGGVTLNLENPLRGIAHEHLMTEVEIFARERGLMHILGELKKGALLAQDSQAYKRYSIYSDTDIKCLEDEVHTSGLKLARSTTWVVVMSSLAAAIQGMDETVVNGAQLLYAKQFGIYSASDHIRHLLISFVTCVWSALTGSWWHLFIARFFLGVGIGPKSATVPVYAAECSPAAIRGALVMMWQMWTAFGIFLGTLVDLAFYYIPNRGGIEGLNWRLMLAAAGIPGLIVCLQAPFAPESPRWLISKGRYEDAFNELCRLRFSRVQAARDLYYIHVLLEAENEMKKGRNRVVEMFTIPRNRNAALASWIVMFAQQFCGVNVIAYYSSNIFSQSGFSDPAALAASLGFGALNWLFALPAVFTNGRLAGCHHRNVPVPFVYSAEAFPLYIRDIGMSFATATTWFWNFTLSVTWPSMSNAFKPQGAFGWYAAWCMILWVLILLFVRETKGKTLEELDQSPPPVDLYEMAVENEKCAARREGPQNHVQ